MNRQGLFSPVFLLQVLVVLASLSACSTKQPVSMQPLATPKGQQKIQAQLTDQFQRWQSVPYRAGGASRSGVDCSGFVWVTYREQFGLELPRTTTQLARSGTRLDVREARPGDLLFFKTGWFTRHVGISLDRERFMHASSQQGVVISTLSEPYWQEHFWQARRILQ